MKINYERLEDALITSSAAVIEVLQGYSAEYPAYESIIEGIKTVQGILAEDNKKSRVQEVERNYDNIISIFSQLGVIVRTRGTDKTYESGRLAMCEFIMQLHRVAMEQDIEGLASICYTLEKNLDVPDTEILQGIGVQTLDGVVPRSLSAKLMMAYRVFIFVFMASTVISMLAGGKLNPIMLLGVLFFLVFYVLMVKHYKQLYSTKVYGADYKRINLKR